MVSSSTELPSPDEIYSWVLEQNDPEIIGLFERMGSGDPVLSWSPDDQVIQIKELRRLNQYWRALAGSAMPPRSAFLPEDVFYILGNLNLIDHRIEENILHYRLFGTLIAERYGKDLTGESVPEAPPTLGRFFAAVYRAVLATGEPLYTRHVPPPDSTVKDCQRLILPFADDSGTARHLLVAHLPYQPPSGSVARPGPYRAVARSTVSTRSNNGWSSSPSARNAATVAE